MASNKCDITPAQLVLLTAGSALMYPYTFLPVLNTPPKNQDVWASMLMGVVYILIIGLPLLILSNRFKRIKTVDIFNLIFGKVISKVFLFLWCGFFLFCYTACLVMMVIFIKIYVLTSTPDWAVVLYLSIPAVYGATKGAGTIGRISMFIVPPVIFSIIFFFIFALPDMNINFIRPILAESSFLDFNVGGFLTAARYSEIIIFFVFTHYLIKKASVNKTFATSLGIFGISFFVILISVLLLLGYDYAREQWNPYFVFARQIETYDFLRRLQSVNLIIWVPMAMLKLMLYLYMFGHVMEGIFKTKTHKYFSIGAFVVGGILATMPMLNNMVNMRYLRSDEVFPFIVLPATVVVPLIMLITYLTKRKKIDKKIKKKLQEQNNSA